MAFGKSVKQTARVQILQKLEFDQKDKLTKEPTGQKAYKLVFIDEEGNLAVSWVDSTHRLAISEVGEWYEIEASPGRKADQVWATRLWDVKVIAESSKA